jgi:hypothetical protein
LQNGLQKQNKIKKDQNSSWSTPSSLPLGVGEAKKMHKTQLLAKGIR